jgi:hypothetical protein
MPAKGKTLSLSLSLSLSIERVAQPVKYIHTYNTAIFKGVLLSLSLSFLSTLFTEHQLTPIFLKCSRFFYKKIKTKTHTEKKSEREKTRPYKRKMTQVYNLIIERGEEDRGGGFVVIVVVVVVEVHRRALRMQSFLFYFMNWVINSTRTRSGGAYRGMMTATCCYKTWKEVAYVANGSD